MLATILPLLENQLSALADAWLSKGANAVELWSGACLLACWPPDSADRPATASITAPILVGGSEVGLLRVAGVSGGAAQQRLATDAALIARLGHLEHEQENMVAELIEIQDQLLVVYDLTQSACYHTYYEEIGEVLDCLTREITRMLDVEGCFMLVRSGEQLHLACHPPSLNEALPDTLVEQVLLNENELLLNGSSSEITLPPRIECLFYSPFQMRTTTTAGLGLLNKAGGFASPDLKLARAVAEQAGTRIENFLLHQENLKQTRMQTEMEMARQVQQRLLPQQVPEVAGLDMHAAWRPARQASGDFYDFIQRPDHPFIFTLGDVSGKGMPAALITVEALTELRSQARVLLDPNPASIMSSLNEVLYDDFTRAEMLATIFIGQYDPVCCELRYTNAGHAPVISCPADGPARLLKASAPPIGVLSMLSYQNETLILNPDDLLIVATDGFNESFNGDGDMFGYERLLQQVEKVRHAPAHEIIRSLFAAVDEFTGYTRTHHTLTHHTLDDDQAIIVLKGTGTSTGVCVSRSTTIRLDLPALPASLDILAAAIETILKQHTTLEDPEKTIYETRLAIHELCVNIIEHAYGGAREKTTGYIALTITLIPFPHRLIVETYDTGEPFDPSRVPEPELLGERGRGLQLIRALMDEVSYLARNEQTWHTTKGQPWQTEVRKPPQPGRNCWYLVKLL
jgi:sigma-B regulation protein RsbU (phosphoserine phosphatase)